jgi:hypothetical protein
MLSLPLHEIGIIGKMAQAQCRLGINAANPVQALPAAMQPTPQQESTVFYEAGQRHLEGLHLPRNLVCGGGFKDLQPPLQARCREVYPVRLGYRLHDSIVVIVMRRLCCHRQQGCTAIRPMALCACAAWAMRLRRESPKRGCLRRQSRRTCTRRCRRTTPRPRRRRRRNAIFKIGRERK